MPHDRFAALFSCSLLAFVVGIGSSPKVLAQPFIDIDEVAPNLTGFSLTDSLPEYPNVPTFDTFLFDTDALRFELYNNGSRVAFYFLGDFATYAQSTGMEVAIFPFDSIDVSKNIIATGSRRLAILSRTDATFSGTIDVSGNSVDGRPFGALGELGAGSGGRGNSYGGSESDEFSAKGGGGAGGGAAADNSQDGESGDGGSYGGIGGTGYFNSNPAAATYGDLTQVLRGGSGGGGGNGYYALASFDGAGGGAGGGAIELGAAGNLTVTGTVLANGGGTTDGESFFGDHAGAGGGGSGGGVRLHGGTIDLLGQIEARGGRGDHQQPGEPEGGGGGGGRVLLVGDELVLRGSLPIDVAGGPGNTAGGTGVKEVLLDKLVIPTGDSVQLFGNFGNAKLAPATSEYDQHYDVEVETGATLEAFKFAGTVGEVSLAAGSTLQTNIFSANTLISVERIVGAGNLELAHPLTISNGSGTTYHGNITLDDPLTIDSDTNYTIAGEINSGLSVNDDFDCCDVIKRGSGTLTLSGDNSGFRGDIIVEAGTLELTTSTAFGNFPNIIFPRAPRLRLNDGSTLLVSNSMSFDAPNNRVTLSGATTMEVPDATQLTIESQVSGGGTLTKTGNGTLELFGANTFTGGVEVNGGTVSIDDDNSLGASGSVLTFNANDRRVVVTATHTSTHPIQIAGVNGTINTPADVTFTQNAPINGTGFFRKAGPGTMILNSQNTQIGTQIFEGTLILSGAPDEENLRGFVSIFSGATLQVDSSEGVGRLFGDGELVLNDFLAVNEGGESSTFVGTISGPSNLRKDGAGTLTLTGSNTHLGGVIINDGTLLANNTEGSATGSGQVDVNNGGTLGGNGTVAGTIDVRSGGTVAPGTSAGSLTAGSDVTFYDGGKLHSILAIELGGTTQTDEYDLLEVNGQVTIEDGAKLNVTLIDGFVPTAGDSFEILTAAGGITGTFDATLPAFLGDLEWKEIYTPTTLSLEFILPGDFNNDGTVDAADYTVWRDNLGANVALPNESTTLGQVTQEDYDTWRANFGITAASLTANQAGVPEPSAFALFAIAAGFGLLRKPICTAGQRGRWRSNAR